MIDSDPLARRLWGAADEARDAPLLRMLSPIPAAAGAELIWVVV